MIDHQAALIYTMVLVSAADRNMSDAEMRIIGDNVRDLPVFAAERFVRRGICKGKGHRRRH